MTAHSSLLLSTHSQLLDVICSATVINAPFPHTMLDGALPQPFLEQLYRNLPNQDCFQEAGHGLHTFQIWGQCEDMQRLQSDKRAFWEQCNQSVFNMAIAKALHALFAPARKTLYQMLFDNGATEQQASIELQDWNSSGALNIRAAGSHLPTHMDWPNRLYSLVVYLDPEQNANPEWGTRLFHGPRATGRQGREIMAKRHPDASQHPDTMDATLVPFQAGRIVVFMNTPWSYHGASVAGAGRASRWCLVKGINMTLDSAESLFGLPPALR